MSSKRIMDVLKIKMWNLWPPFLASGISIKEVGEGYRDIVVQAKLRFWNSNYVGTIFGGTLYSMTDPFYMVMLIANLGSDYVVWDKAASIKFRRPGMGKVFARFTLSEEQIAQIKQQADTEGKSEPTLYVDVIDEQNNVVARAEKLLYVARKDKHRQRHSEKDKENLGR